MANGKNHKNFTADGDVYAEELLEQILAGMKADLEDSGFSVYLGGSYGRGEGGVRQDRENGILYNDLDLFVFYRKKSPRNTALLKSISEKYEKMLHVDVDFSTPAGIREIKRNHKRLMMQELKRGHRLICGEDLLETYLPALPPEELPFSEACRLLLNRGMGLMLAGKKISGRSDEPDFILRNIYKGILGAGDALLIARGQYCWRINERVEALMKSELPREWKELYHRAAEFKRSPSRSKAGEIELLWRSACDFLRASILKTAGTEEKRDLQRAIFEKCEKCGELSFMNYIKYCVKCRSAESPLDWKRFGVPPVAPLLVQLFDSLYRPLDLNGELYRKWQIFN